MTPWETAYARMACPYCLGVDRVVEDMRIDAVEISGEQVVTHVCARCGFSAEPVRCRLPGASEPVAAPIGQMKPQRLRAITLSDDVNAVASAMPKTIPCGPDGSMDAEKTVTPIAVPSVENEVPAYGVQISYRLGNARTGEEVAVESLWTGTSIDPSEMEQRLRAAAMRWKPPSETIRRIEVSIPQTPLWRRSSPESGSLQVVTRRMP